MISNLEGVVGRKREDEVDFRAVVCRSNFADESVCASPHRKQGCCLRLQLGLVLASQPETEAREQIADRP